MLVPFRYVSGTSWTPFAPTRWHITEGHFVDGVSGQVLGPESVTSLGPESVAAALGPESVTSFGAVVRDNGLGAEVGSTRGTGVRDSGLGVGVHDSILGAGVRGKFFGVGVRDSSLGAGVHDNSLVRGSNIGAGVRDSSFGAGVRDSSRPQNDALGLSWVSWPVWWGHGWSPEEIPEGPVCGFGVVLRGLGGALGESCAVGAPRVGGGAVLVPSPYAFPPLRAVVVRRPGVASVAFPVRGRFSQGRVHEPYQFLHSNSLPKQEP